MAVMEKGISRPTNRKKHLLFLFLFAFVVYAAGQWVWTSEEAADPATIEASHKQESSPPTPSPTGTKKLINQCEDPDADPTNPIEQKNIDKCQCGEANVAVINSSKRAQKWMAFHEVWKQAVEYAVASSNAQPDVCFVGDSLIEHWNGTIGLGIHQHPELRAVFDKYFGADDMHGMALGSSGDTTRMLLWHLQNGILDNLQFQPKLWMLLIGTNDLGVALCSKQAALEGILYVAHTIQQARPNSAILIHGLLPRGADDGNMDGNMTLGRYWNKIQWINNQLQRAIADQPDYYYMDSEDLFLTENGKQLNSAYFQDGLHPEAPGLDVWGPKIVQRVQSILQERNG